MPGVDWGWLYQVYRDTPVDREAIPKETLRLIDDDDVIKQSGIYAYMLTRNERHLSIRAFTAAMKRRVYERQQGRCALCGEEFALPQMEADHITPWAEGGGATVVEKLPDALQGRQPKKRSKVEGSGR